MHDKMKNLLTNIIKKPVLLLVMVIVFAVACKQQRDVEVADLLVEYLQEPLGVDTSAPRFSWKLKSDQRGVNQQAFQMIVGESHSEVNRKSGKIWDTGKVHGGQTVNLEYAGAPLQSNKKYYWRVGVWLDDETSVWSDPAMFHMGILNDGEWKAQWVTAQETITDESPLLRRQFQVDKKVEQAIAYVTARGFYEFYLNGEKVGDHVLDPAITDYRKTILYSTFDVTPMLKRGTNVAGAILGNGAWNLRKTEGRWSWGTGGDSLGKPAFLMQLMITYSDGSQAVVVTDNAWKYGEGPITFNNLYGGEDYDARKEVDGWLEEGFNDNGWKQVVQASEPAGRLKSQMMPPLRVTETIQPVKMINPSPGKYIFDLGQNIAGWWRLQVNGTPGQVMRVRAAETLNNGQFPKPLEEGDNISTKYRYQEQIWTDYTLKGNGAEVYEPRFFYNGFRYIEVTMNDNKNPAQLNIEGKVVRTDVERNGNFESSDPLINQIHLAGLWAQKGNFHSYPTDCPQREKGAYNGDGQVMAETSMHDFHMASFYTKWVNDMRDAQQDNGRIPNTSPTLVGGMGGGVAWGSAYILLPWWMHNYYNDTRILQQHYPNMKRYVLYLKDLGTKDENPEEPYIINNFYSYWYSLGEWVAPGQKNCPNQPVVNTFYYYYNSLLLSKIAEVLGHTEDSRYFLALSDTVRQEFNKKFYDPKTALYGSKETFQTYQLLALLGDVAPEGDCDRVFNTIVDDIEMRDGHLNTGIIGTKYLFPTLASRGQGELAFTVATKRTYPSYGYWLDNHSTTLIEEWDGANSHNHHMFGSVVEYFYKYLAGIQSPMEGNTSKGYNHIFIEPQVPEKLDYVDASLETVSGTIASSWKKDGNSFRHEVTVPANTTAVVSLPAGSGNVTVWEGNSRIWDGNGFVNGTPGILGAEKTADRIKIRTGSGNYRFRVEF
jgi:alpha-L-rhamnosidase